MANEFYMEPTSAGLNGRDDDELRFNVFDVDYDKIKEEDTISMVGHMTEKDYGCYMISTSEHEIRLQAQGWQGLEQGKKQE